MRGAGIAGSDDGTTVRSSVDGVFLGRVTVAGTIHYALGSLDEIQVSAATRSPAWIKLAFENQKANSSWIEFGPRAGRGNRGVRKAVPGRRDA